MKLTPLLVFLFLTLALVVYIRCQRPGPRLPDIHTYMDRMSAHENNAGQEWQDAEDPHRRTLE